MDEQVCAQHVTSLNFNSKTNFFKRNQTQLFIILITLIPTVLLICITYISLSVSKRLSLQMIDSFEDQLFQDQINNSKIRNLALIFQLNSQIQKIPWQLNLLNEFLGNVLLNNVIKNKKYVPAIHNIDRSYNNNESQEVLSMYSQNHLLTSVWHHVNKTFISEFDTVQNAELDVGVQMDSIWKAIKFDNQNKNAMWLQIKDIFMGHSYDGFIYMTSINTTYSSYPIPEGCPYTGTYRFDIRCRYYYNPTVNDISTLLFSPQISYTNSNPYLTSNFCQRRIRYQNTDPNSASNLYSILCVTLDLTQVPQYFQIFGVNSKFQIFLDPRSLSVIYNSLYPLQREQIETIQTIETNNLQDQNQADLLLSKINEMQTYVLDRQNSAGEFLVNDTYKQITFEYNRNGTECFIIQNLITMIDKVPSFETKKTIDPEKMYELKGAFIFIDVLSKESMTLYATNLQSIIKNYYMIFTYISWGVTVLILIVQLYYSFMFGSYLLHPVIHLTKILNQINIQNQEQNSQSYKNRHHTLHQISTILYTQTRQRAYNTLSDVYQDFNNGSQLDNNLKGICFSSDTQILLESFQNLFKILKFTTQNLNKEIDSVSLLNLNIQIHHFENFGNNRALGVCHNNMGVIHYNNGRYLEALESFQKAIVYGKYELGIYSHQNEGADLVENIQRNTTQIRTTLFQKDSSQKEFNSDIGQNPGTTQIQTISNSPLINSKTSKSDFKNCIENEQLFWNLYNRNVNFIKALASYIEQNKNHLWDIFQDVVLFNMSISQIYISQSNKREMYNYYMILMGIFKSNDSAEASNVLNKFSNLYVRNFEEKQSILPLSQSKQNNFNNSLNSSQQISKNILSEDKDLSPKLYNKISLSNEQHNERLNASSILFSPLHLKIHPQKQDQVYSFSKKIKNQIQKNDILQESICQSQQQVGIFENLEKGQPFSSNRQDRKINSKNIKCSKNNQTNSLQQNSPTQNEQKTQKSIQIHIEDKNKQIINKIERFHNSLLEPTFNTIFLTEQDEANKNPTTSKEDLFLDQSFKQQVSKLKREPKENIDINEYLDSSKKINQEQINTQFSKTIIVDNPCSLTNSEKIIVRKQLFQNNLSKEIDAQCEILPLENKKSIKSAISRSLSPQKIVQRNMCKSLPKSYLFLQSNQNIEREQFEGELKLQISTLDLNSIKKNDQQINIKKQNYFRVKKEVNPYKQAKYEFSSDIYFQYYALQQAQQQINFQNDLNAALLLTNILESCVYYLPHLKKQAFYKLSRIFKQHKIESKELEEIKNKYTQLAYCQFHTFIISACKTIEHQQRAYALSSDLINEVLFQDQDTFGLIKYSFQEHLYFQQMGQTTIKTIFSDPLFFEDILQSLFNKQTNSSRISSITKNNDILKYQNDKLNNYQTSNLSDLNFNKRNYDTEQSETQTNLLTQDAQSKIQIVKQISSSSFKQNSENSNQQKTSEQYHNNQNIKNKPKENSNSQHLQQNDQKRPRNSNMKKQMNAGFHENICLRSLFSNNKKSLLNLTDEKQYSSNELKQTAQSQNQNYELIKQTSPLLDSISYIQKKQNPSAKPLNLNNKQDENGQQSFQTINRNVNQKDEEYQMDTLQSDYSLIMLNPKKCVQNVQPIGDRLEVNNLENSDISTNNNNQLLLTLQNQTSRDFQFQDIRSQDQHKNNNNNQLGQNIFNNSEYQQQSYDPNQLKRNPVDDYLIIDIREKPRNNYLSEFKVNENHSKINQLNTFSVQNRKEEFDSCFQAISSDQLMNNQLTQIKNNYVTHANKSLLMHKKQDKQIEKQKNVSGEQQRGRGELIFHQGIQAALKLFILNTDEKLTCYFSNKKFKDNNPKFEDTQIKYNQSYLIYITDQNLEFNNKDMLKKLCELLANLDLEILILVMDCQYTNDLEERFQNILFNGKYVISFFFTEQMLLQYIYNFREHCKNYLIPMILEHF